MPKPLHQSPFGVFVRSWTSTKDARDAGIKKFLESELYGLSHGHTSIEMRLPVNEHTEKLLSDYCSDMQTYPNGTKERLIPYRKELIIQPDGATVECYKVYFSWWLMQDGLIDPKTKRTLHDVVTDYNESRRSRVRYGIDSETRDDKLYTRFMSGMFGRKEIQLHQPIKMKEAQNLHPELKKLFELKVEIANINEQISSLEVLLKKLDQIKKSDSIKITDSTLILIEALLGKKYLSYIKSTSEVDSSNLQILRKEAGNKIAELKQRQNKLIKSQQEQKSKIIKNFDFESNTMDDDRSSTQRGIPYKIRILKSIISKKNNKLLGYHDVSDKELSDIRNTLGDKFQESSLSTRIFTRRRCINSTTFEQYVAQIKENLEISSNSIEDFNKEIKKLEEKQKMLYREHKQKHLQYGKEADNEVFLPLAQSEFPQSGHTLGMNVEGMLGEMKKLRLTETYDFLNLNCVITTRRILAAGAANTTIKKLAQYKAIGSIDNPQMAHVSALHIQSYINGNASIFNKILPLRISLTETLIGIIVNLYLDYNGEKDKDQQKKKMIKLCAAAIVLLPTALGSALIGSLLNPTYNIVNCIDLIDYAFNNSYKSLGLKIAVCTTAVTLLVPAIALLLLPAIIENIIKLALFTAMLPYVFVNKLLANRSSEPKTKLEARVETKSETKPEPKSESMDEPATKPRRTILFRPAKKIDISERAVKRIHDAQISAMSKSK